MRHCTSTGKVNQETFAQHHPILSFPLHRVYWCLPCLAFRTLGMSFDYYKSYFIRSPKVLIDIETWGPNALRGDKVYKH